MTQQTQIDKFEGNYSFLSNFFPCLVIYNGKQYKSVEHAYQAAKVLSPEEHDQIAAAKTPAESKKLARSFTLRPNWDDIKVQIMADLLFQKFTIPELKEKLLATGNAELVEGNWWNDTFWGVCRGRGKNTLGRLLMELRDTLRELGEDGVEQPSETNI